MQLPCLPSAARPCGEMRRAFEDVEIGCEPGGILMPCSRTTITAEAHVSLMHRRAAKPGSCLQRHQHGSELVKRWPFFWCHARRHV